jgi:glucose/arabinose dehydrogenase
MTDDEKTLKSARTLGTFCSGIANQDVNYCYPGILGNGSLNTQLQSAKSSKEGCVCLEEYGSGLRNPVFVRNAGDGSNLLYVGEQGGIVYIYKNKTKVQKPFLDIVNKVTTSGNAGEERGLLGMAFHPNYSDNGKFYIYYSISVMDPAVEMIKVSEFKVSSNNKNLANLSSERQIITVVQPYWNHNGGEVSH